LDLHLAISEFDLSYREAREGASTAQEMLGLDRPTGQVRLGGGEGGCAIWAAVGGDGAGVGGAGTAAAAPPSPARRAGMKGLALDAFSIQRRLFYGGAAVPVRASRLSRSKF